MKKLTPLQFKIRREMLYRPTSKEKIRRWVHQECRSHFGSDAEFNKEFNRLWRKFNNEKTH